MGESPKELYGWELVIAGPDYGGYIPDIKRLKKHHIHYAGVISGEEKLDLLNSAKLLVLPSKSENYGIVVAEALASAVPVLVTDTTPWRHLSALGAGSAVKIERFEQQMFGLLKDQALLMAMSRAARAYACENLGWDQSRERYSQLLKEEIGLEINR